MMNQAESEGSLSFGRTASFSTTTYTYEVDFAQEGYEAGSSWLFLATRFLKRLAILGKTLLITPVIIGWEVLKFSACYLFYLQKKAVATAYLLEDLKDLVVRILMWRRGFLFRPTTHGGLLVIVSVAFVVGSLFRSGVAPADFTRDSVLAAQNTPETIIPEGRPRSEIVKYAIKDGDSLSAIASAYSVSVDSIKWVNGLAVDSVKPGDTLSIPPVTGVIHKVAEGETIAFIAQKYEADQQTIVDYPFNYIDDSLTLRAGQTLIVPGGKIPAPKPVWRVAAKPPLFIAGGSGLFIWPVVGGISQFPSWWHPAVDIAAPYSSGVYAAAAGRVVAATWGSGFGNYVMIDHGNGYTSAYAHLSAFNVGAGRDVSKGQLIGAVGCSGRCTGPHLHFEVRNGGVAINPLSLLP